MPNDIIPAKKQAQYIANLLCENSAAKSGADLPEDYWKIDEWRKFFVWQVTIAHRFLREYEFDTVVTFIKQKNIYSLAAGWIVDALLKFKPIKYEQVTIEMVDKSLGRINKDIDFGFLD